MSSQLLGFWLTVVGLGFCTVITDAVSPMVAVCLLIAGLVILFAPFFTAGSISGRQCFDLQVGDWCSYRSRDSGVILAIHRVTYFV